MKSKINILYAIIILQFFLVTNGFSQEGYIETDSIYLEGRIYYDPRRPDVVSFQKNKNEVIEKYTASDIRGFGDFKGKAEYESHEIVYDDKLQAIFLRIEEKSNFNIYSLRNRDRIFVFTDQLIELKKDSYKNQIESIVGPCSRSDVNDLPFNIEAISTLFRYYGKTGKCYVTQNLEAGVFSGFTTSVLKVQENSEYNFGAGAYESKYSGIPVGAYVKIPSFQIPGLHWLVQFQYQEHIYQTQQSGSSRELDVSITAKSIQFTPAIYYEFGAGMIRPYLYTGPALQHYFNSESKMLLVIYNVGDASYTQENNWMKESGTTAGFHWGAGLRLAKLGKTYISAEYQGGLFSYPENFQILINNIQIKIGI